MKTLPNTSTTRLCPVCGDPIRNRKAKTCGYRCGGKLQRQASEKKYRLDAFAEWSSEMVYALGLLYSDGCLTRQKKRGSWRIQFGNTSRATVQWFHDWIGNPGKITYTPPGPLQPKPHWKVQATQARKARYKTTVSSDTLGNRLFQLGIRPNKSNQEVPLPRVPAKFTAMFARGLFDGDGGVWFASVSKMPGGKNLHVSLTCGPVQARGMIAALLENQGVGFTKSGISLQVRGSHAEKFCRWIYAEEGPRMREKHEVWEDWRAFRNRVAGDLILDVGYQQNRDNVKGLQPKEWHAWIGVRPITEVAQKAGVSRSRVYQVRKVLQNADAA